MLSGTSGDRAGPETQGTAQTRRFKVQMFVRSHVVKSSSTLFWVPQGGRHRRGFL